MHVNWWRSITVWILPHLHNLYVSITQSLDNIEMRCNRGLQTSWTLKMEKKGKNGTQFVFCKCIIRFFSQLCKNNTWDWFSWRFPNDSCKWEKTFFLWKPCQFSWQTLEMLLARCRQCKKSWLLMENEWFNYF